MKINFEKIKKAHFVGIGGIGTSAIALLLKQKNIEVSGSDGSESPIVEKMRANGIHVSIGHNAKNIPESLDLLVHTIAIKEDNPELIKAREIGALIATYPQMLSVVSKHMQTIAVSGTHGKTTTTAMLAKVLIDAQIDPTVIVGSLMKDSETNTNLIVGKSDYFIVEACEYRRSFLNLYPKILIITNIDTDHLDYYKDLADIQSAFRELALRIPKDGAIICNTHDPKVQLVIHELKCKIIDYIPYVDGNLQLKAPGEHNRQNAGAVSAVADFLSLEKSNTKKSLMEFTGTWRRFDLKGQTKNGTIVYDDYAHHPQEIRVTLAGLKEMYPNKKRVVFFQPHLFSRTKMLLDEFAQVFPDIDEVHILPIYASRESFDDSINSQMLTDKINKNTNNAFHIATFEQATKKITNFNYDTVIILMGAGDIYTLSDNLELKKTNI